MINKQKVYIDNVLGRYKNEEFLNLINKWVDNFSGKKVLKTDLWEEAFGDDGILFVSSSRDSAFFALDISIEITKKAHIKQRDRGFMHKYLTADTRNLPFKDNVFDAILSSSTLDHFSSPDDLIKSLLELKRVVKPGGEMIIALNNKYNINFYLMLKIERLLGLSHYPVQFYGIKQLNGIIDEIGLSILDTRYIVQIISPLNKLLILMRKYINKAIVDKIAEKSILLSRFFGNREKIKLFTSWFIVLKCIKE